MFCSFCKVTKVRSIQVGAGRTVKLTLSNLYAKTFNPVIMGSAAAPYQTTLRGYTRGIIKPNNHLSYGLTRKLRKRPRPACPAAEASSQLRRRRTLAATKMLTIRMIVTDEERCARRSALRHCLSCSSPTNEAEQYSTYSASLFSVFVFNI